MGQSRFIYRFILLPSFVGLACYGCVSAADERARSTRLTESVANHVNEKESPSIGDRQADHHETSTNKTVVPASSAHRTTQSTKSYREAINLASSAYILSLSAVSPDDWGLISSRWQRAADQLEKVNANSEHYAAAQQKMIEYARHATHATETIHQLQKSVQLPPRPKQPIAVVPLARTTAIASTGRNVQVPVTRRLHGTPVVQVTFNDSRTYEMILDTGASRTLITRQMADELGIIPTDKMIAATASAAEVTFDIGQANSISIEDVRLLDAKVSIGDSVNIGLLGNDFLKGYDVTIRDRTVELAVAQ